MIYGYARVSTKEQNLMTQIKQLEEHKCDEIFKEKVSGRTTNRAQFQKLMSIVTTGDTIVITKLDRIARSAKDALNIIETLNERGVALTVINMGGDTLNTTTPIGRLIVTVLSGIAEFEVDMIKERQQEGIALAKKRGVYRGRPKTYNSYHKGLEHALKLFQERDTNHMTVKQICQITRISKATLYRAYKNVT